MNWHQIMGGAVAVAAVISTLMAGATVVSGATAVNTVHAAPATLARATLPTYGVPHETSKVVLPETSNDGPAFWTLPTASSPTGPLAVIAWTGTDGRLNVMGGNGLTYTRKTTLNETSFVRPAVVRGLGSGEVAPIALAWTGTDPGHHLNVLYSVPGSTPMKLTLWRENSFTSPALGWLTLTGVPMTLLLGWAGTDANHALNLLPISITSHGLVAGTKTTFWGFHSLGQPLLSVALAPVPAQPTHNVLGWIDLASHRIAWATSLDAKTWTPQQMFPEMSRSAPSMLGILGIDLPQYWAAWTGTDIGHHVNVLYAVTFSSWATNYVKTTLAETAVGGAQIGFVPSKAMLVAWTGTDTMHHLNVAMVGL